MRRVATGRARGGGGDAAAGRRRRAPWPPTRPAPDPAAAAGGPGWTRLGLADAPGQWAVDPRGLAGPVGEGWSLEWWVGAEDRWHRAGEEVAVRQRLVDAVVVETSLRVPGGDVRVRHYAVPDQGRASLAVEIENDSAAPVSVAVMVRAGSACGPGRLRRVAVTGGWLAVEGQVVLGGPVGPRHSVLGTDDAVVAAALAASATAPTLDGDVDSPDGTAAAAAVWPLVHRGVLHLVAAAASGPGARGAWRPAPAPSPGAVAAAWSARLAGGVVLGLPAGPLATTLAVTQRRLLVGGPVPAAAAALPAGLAWSASREDLAEEVAARCAAGRRDDAAGTVDGWLDGQHRRGTLGDGAVATAASLWALEAWAASGPDDGGIVARSPLAVARAAEYLARHGGGPDGDGAPWVVAGLRAASGLLRRVGETGAAAQAADWAAQRAAAWLAATDAATADVPDPGAGPDGVGAATVAALLATHLGVLDAGHRLAVRARRAAGADPDGSVTVGGPQGGRSPRAALLLAESAVRAGEDPAAQLRWLAGTGGPTAAWPALIRTGGGRVGGDDALVVASWWSLAAALLGDAEPTGGSGPTGGTGPTGPGPTGGPGRTLALCRWWPPEWIGRDAEVHALPTPAGALSWAVRWHGPRPALLWEVDGAAAADVVLRAPGLDASWRGSGPRGEALLAEVAPTGGAGR